MQAGSTLYDDPDLYDVFTPGRCEAFYVGAAERSPGPVLELGCGTGRVALALASRGLDVTGLDLSPAMLEAARRKAAAQAIDVALVQADMRHFDLDPRRFGAILVPINALLHLEATEDLIGCLARVRRHLAPGGLLAFDVFNPNPQRFAIGRAARRLVGRFPAPDGCEITVEETLSYDAVRQVNSGTLYFSTPERPDFRVTPMRQRYIFPQELPLLLGAAGLALVERWGDFDGGAFTSDSLHQVCVCRAA